MFCYDDRNSNKYCLAGNSFFLLDEKLSQMLLRISGHSEEQLFLELWTSSISFYSSRDWIKPSLIRLVATTEPTVSLQITLLHSYVQDWQIEPEVQPAITGQVASTQINNARSRTITSIVHKPLTLARLESKQTNLYQNNWDLNQEWKVASWSSWSCCSSSRFSYFCSAVGCAPCRGLLILGFCGGGRRKKGKARRLELAHQGKDTKRNTSKSFGKEAASMVPWQMCTSTAKSLDMWSKTVMA